MIQKLISIFALSFIFSISLSPKDIHKNDTIDAVAGYIHKHGRLPDFYLKKKEAEKLGWNPGKGNLCSIAPGKNIGGDRFQNREKKLTYKKGRTYFEADVNYKCGRRGAERIIFSNDGWIYKTLDHYKTFQVLYEGK